MEELFVPHKIAILAKENGYNEKTFKVYDTQGAIQEEAVMDILEQEKVNAPLYQQLIDWFRETHKLHIKVQWRTFAVKNCDGYYYDFNDTGKRPQDYHTGSDSYYGTMNIALTKAFELIKK